MARSVVVALATLAFGIAAVPSFAADEAVGSPGLSRIVSSDTLRVGMSGAQPPLNFKSKSGQMMGLEVDLANALAGLMGVELKIVQKPFAELLGALAAGEVDLVMSGMTTTPERSIRAAFVGPYFLSGKSILTRSSSLAQVNKAGDLDQASLKLAALEGSTSASFVETALPKATLVKTRDSAAAVKLLIEGKVNAVVADREAVQLAAFLNPKEGLATLREPLTIEPIGIASPGGDPMLTTYLENALGALEASGLMSAVRSRWIENSEWVQELP
jgi:ABC-type amino acid transport substrate-binding protein